MVVATVFRSGNRKLAISRPVFRSEWGSEATDGNHTNEMHTIRERLLMFPHLLLNLRLKIAESGGPKGHRSGGESLASAR